MEIVSKINEIDIENLERGKTYRFWLELGSNPLGEAEHIPVLVTRGVKEGPILGITSTIHGNELNGIPAVQRVFRKVTPENLRGTIVGLPVLNVSGIADQKRNYVDGQDLNHVMPGKAKGRGSEVYAYNLFTKLIRQFDYLIDLHTASKGNVNSYHVRVDMDDEVATKMAHLQNAEIILHNPPHDGTLRGAAAAEGIRAITVEAGNPYVFQKDMIYAVLVGVYNIMMYLDMMDGKPEPFTVVPIVCRSSYWTYTNKGGFLQVLPQVKDIVRKGQLIAVLQNVFGDVLETYRAPDDGIVVGKRAYPNNHHGSRIIHLGVWEE